MIFSGKLTFSDSAPGYSHEVGSKRPKNDILYLPGRDIFFQNKM
jgi:hypothetical protein